MSNSLSDSNACPWAMDLKAYEVHVEDYRRHVVELGYDDSGVCRFMALARHFYLWLVLSAETLEQISELLVQKFASLDLATEAAGDKADGVNGL